LEEGKIYRAISDREAESHGMIRVIDESGGDYLFAARRFESVALPARVKRALLDRVAAAPALAARRRSNAAPASLRNCVLQVLQDYPRGLPLKQLVEAVRKAGYESRPASLSDEVEAILAETRGPGKPNRKPRR
jgi:hypothetical protein